MADEEQGSVIKDRAPRPRQDQVAIQACLQPYRLFYGTKKGCSWSSNSQGYLKTCKLLVMLRNALIALNTAEWTLADSL
jgi:hypothetical protein